MKRFLLTLIVALVALPVLASDDSSHRHVEALTAIDDPTGDTLYGVNYGRTNESGFYLGATVFQDQSDDDETVFVHLRAGQTVDRLSGDKADVVLFGVLQTQRYDSNEQAISDTDEHFGAGVSVWLNNFTLSVVKMLSGDESIFAGIGYRF